MGKFLVMNVNHVSGISKAGRPYDITKLTAFKSVIENSGNFRGMKPMEFNCESSILNTLPELPAVCDVEYDIEPGYNSEVRMVVKAVKLVSKLEIKF